MLHDAVPKHAHPHAYAQRPHQLCTPATPFAESVKLSSKQKSLALFRIARKAPIRGARHRRPVRPFTFLTQNDIYPGLPRPSALRLRYLSESRYFHRSPRRGLLEHGAARIVFKLSWACPWGPSCVRCGLAAVMVLLWSCRADELAMTVYRHIVKGERGGRYSEPAPKRRRQARTRTGGVWSMVKEHLHS